MHVIYCIWTKAQWHQRGVLLRDRWVFWVSAFFPILIIAFSFGLINCTGVLICFVSCHQRFVLIVVLCYGSLRPVTDNLSFPGCITLYRQIVIKLCRLKVIGQWNIFVRLVFLPWRIRKELMMKPHTVSVYICIYIQSRVLIVYVQISLYGRLLISRSMCWWTVSGT